MDTRFYFNDRSLKALKPPPIGQKDYWDLQKQPRGFGLRISATGTKSFTLTYRADDPKTRQRRLHRIVVGRYPEISLADAREKAEGLRGKISNGENPIVERRFERQGELDRESFGALADMYLKEHAMVKKRSWREDERILRFDLLPKFKDYKAHLITRGDVKTLLKEIVDRGAPVQANRTLALIRKIFNFGIREEILEVNPCSRLPMPGGEESERERALSFTELGLLLEGLKEIESPIDDYFRLLILLAQRPGETLRMEWSEVDLAEGWWIIPGLKTKNKLAHRVPLTAIAVRILMRLQAKANGSKYVFPGRWDEGALCNIKRSLRTLRETTKIDFRPHDLRRTTSSQLTSMGIQRLTVKRILNHKDAEITAVYDRYSYDKEKKDALELWAKFIGIHFPLETGVIDGE